MTTEKVKRLNLLPLNVYSFTNLNVYIYISINGKHPAVLLLKKTFFDFNLSVIETVIRIKYHPFKYYFYGRIEYISRTICLAATAYSVRCTVIDSIVSTTRETAYYVYGTNYAVNYRHV